MRTKCQPCPRGLESRGQQERCCAPFGTCERPMDPTIPWVYDTATGRCDNRRPEQSGTLCRAQDSTRCLQAVYCSGTNVECDLRKEIESVVRTSTATINLQGAYGKQAGVS